jgi:hypothetical protein
MVQLFMGKKTQKKKSSVSGSPRGQRERKINTVGGTRPRTARSRGHWSGIDRQGLELTLACTIDISYRTPGRPLLPVPDPFPGSVFLASFPPS